MYKLCFPDGPSEQTGTHRLKKSSFRCRRKIGALGEKPAEANLDWKLNGHSVPGPGIEPRLSGPQCRASTATPPPSPGIRWLFFSIDIFSDDIHQF